MIQNRRANCFTRKFTLEMGPDPFVSQATQVNSNLCRRNGGRTEFNMIACKRILAVLTAFILMTMPYAASAAEIGQPITVVTEDGTLLPNSYLIEGTTYVPFRAFCDAFGIGGRVEWREETRTATYTAEELEIEAEIGQPYLTANGRILFRNAENKLIDGRTYVPVRALAAAFDREVIWKDSGTAAERTVTLSGKSRAIASAETVYDAESLFWLARVIRAEAEGEPLLGKIAVGNVVMNRVASELFPDTVYEVIFDTRGGSVQFYRPGDVHVQKEPTAECLLAAMICLEGYSISNQALFYLNPRIASSFWIVRNRSYLFSIGLHDFYA